MIKKDALFGIFALLVGLGIGFAGGWFYVRFQARELPIKENLEVQKPSTDTSVQQPASWPLSSAFVWEGDNLHWYEYDLTPTDGFDDPGSLVSLDQSSPYFLKDSQSVYTHDVPDDKYRKIQDADPNTFVVLSVWDYNVAYSKDKNSVFYKDKVVTGADTKTFVALKFSNESPFLYGKDAHNVYAGIDIIPDADPATFVSSSADLEKYDAEDKNHKYLKGKIVQ